MNCMKCGREIDTEQVFCEVCLADMEKYPVKPGTAVQLPRRPEPSGGKKTRSRRRSAFSAEEQVKQLKKRVRLLAALLVITLGLLAALGYFFTRHLMEEDRLLPGQNYSAVDTSTTPFSR